MAPNKIRIPTNAVPGRRSPKNSPDQATFSASWTKNRARANLAPLHPALRQTSQALSAIRKYRTDHTGAKIQLGGLNDGFMSSAYQVPTEDEVQMDPALRRRSTRTGRRGAWASRGQTWLASNCLTFSMY